MPMRALRKVTPWAAAELFAAGNIAFLAVDVWVAHAVNRFALPQEWIPVVFSIAAPFVLAIAHLLARRAPRSARTLGLLVGWIALAIGIAGMLFHLESQFFEEQSIKSLVYTAPFVAPLAYAGLGLLLILNRMVPAATLDWARWVILLALGGMFGNFVLSLADHAQNGFFNRAEWISVAAGAFGSSFLLLTFVRPYDRVLRRATIAVLAGVTIVGVLGFALHVYSNLARPATNLWEGFLYGAPVFAPLLYPNIAVLAAIGLWSARRQG
ncbi:MAG: hypothetical protein QOH21_2350 [Acidobacteriota bacterium]|jgi:hypothetical protein|nr:hypothetical protein [Acidobacteriota bacterium]